MKKTIAILSAICILLSLTACDKSNTQYPDYQSGNPADIFGNPIMETEDGFYRNLDSFMLSLCYYDKSTGKAVYLCAKPECQHDGNEYCTATKEGVYYDSNVCLSGRYVYYAASEYVEQDGKIYYRLIRAKTDGTEFTEICTYQTTVGNEDFHSVSGKNDGRTMAIHRGYAIVPFNDYSMPTSTSEYTPNTMIIDLESKSYKRLPTLNIDLTQTEYGQGNYFLYENWLYYTTSTDRSGAEKSLYRYNLKSEITEKINVAEKFTSYAVIDGYIYYSTQADNDTPSKLWKYDSKTEATTDLSNQLMINEIPFSNATFFWDGKRFIIQDDFYWSYNKAVGANHKDKILIMDKDGNALAVYDLQNSPIGSNEHLDYSLKSQNEKLYICTKLSEDDPRYSHGTGQNELILCCEFENLLSGDAKWYEPFDFYQLKDTEEENAGA